MRLPRRHYKPGIDFLGEGTLQGPFQPTCTCGWRGDVHEDFTHAVMQSFEHERSHPRAHYRAA